MPKNFFSLKTIEWRNGEVRLIDQQLIPKKLSYIRCRSYLEIVNAIKNMNVRGAPAIGVAAAMGLALAAYYSKAKTSKRLLKDLEKAKKKIEASRPTAINLFWATERVMNAAKKAGDNKSKIVKTVIEEAKNIAKEDFEVNKRLGKVGSSLIRDGDVVLTHCKWL